MTIVNEPDSERNTHALALMTALRLGTPGGVSAFLKQYEAAQDLAQRLRLGLVALQALPWTPDRVFEPLLADDNELLQKMGIAGRAVTRKSAIPDAMLELARGQWLVFIDDDVLLPRDFLSECEKAFVDGIATVRGAVTITDNAGGCD